MRMSCSSPSTSQIKSKLLANITQALQADGGRLLILAKPLARRAQIYTYGLQPQTTTPIEKNPIWQDILYTETTNDRAPNIPDPIEPRVRVYPIDRIAEQRLLSPLFAAFGNVGIESLLILPLRYDRQCIGCLTLFRSAAKPQGCRWTDEELKLAQSLATELYLAVMEQRVAQMCSNRAYYDVLTGLPNRLLCSQLLTLELAKIPADGEVLATIFLGLDRFKNINDGISYRFGDRLLQLIAERLKNTFDDRAIVGRWGGDEFAILIPALADRAAVNIIADRVLQCFDLPFSFDRNFANLKTNSLYIKASMGIAIATSRGQDSQTLLKHADAALDRAKHNGRNNYEIYNTPTYHPTPVGATSVAEHRLQLEHMLDSVCAGLAGRAIDDRQLLLHYQPQLDIHTGKISGIEALLRCQDLYAKLINPADFIPIAEETGSILPMGEWVIRTACKQKKSWQDRGFGNFPIAVNFSVKQLQDRNLIETIIEILAETGLSPAALEVEITESIAIKDLDLAIAILASLREIGVKISLDDFGTGYSSLAILKYLPLDRLKIDRSFIRELQANTVDAGIVRTIVNLGHELNLNVVAEGVETVEQLEFLRSINCDTVQGFLFSRPLPAAELETTIATGSYWQHPSSHSHN
ncbi:EAL domain-containing protein [Chamaesiphon sp. VAR_48_metabat_403]|uniref:putative bifunctional diguanylate cyclase/phosphodiesterase n=1 Tax=Chamaesiphon sp. VAR_48_metabat_403 TaxID=2964700 RepID=UPI00286E4568|nr:EAL domain-containing protein [Chamaesiphon sp. VAR_48_metabat_403]